VELVEDAVAVDVAPAVARPVIVPQEVDAAAELAIREGEPQS
jgi:hypothetical protein